MAERQMIFEAEDDGRVLALLDGRRIRVDADQRCKTCTWLPTTEIEIVERPDGLSLTVVRTEDGTSVTGRWEH
jgi:hypothetical protein